MNSKQFSNDKHQMQLTPAVSSEEHNIPFEENNFLQEKISFNSTSFDDQPIVTIEYDDFIDQSDPLAVEETVDITNLVSSANRKGKIKIYHPFSEQVKELSESHLSTSPDSCSPSKVARCGKRSEVWNTNHEEVIEVSDDDEAFSTQMEFSDKNSRENVDQNNQSKSIIVDQLADVICVEDETSNILLKELAEQMLQKVEDRRAAANHLSLMKRAETDFSKLLVRQIMKTGNQSGLSSHKSVGHTSQITSKQQKNAEAALARRLVQQLSKGCSLEEAIILLQSIKSSCELTPANSINGENQENLSGKPVAIRPEKGTSRVTPDKVIQGPQAQPHNHVPCSSSSLAKWLSQSASKGDHNTPTPTQRLEAFSSKASALEQALPPYTVAFSHPNGGNSKPSANESFVQGLGDERFPLPNTYRPFSPHALSSYVQLNASTQCSNQPPTPPRASERLCPSLLSGVHPSHLLPPSSLLTTTITIDDDPKDLMVCESVNHFERINPPNVAQSGTSRYLEPSSSISRTLAEPWHWNSLERDYYHNADLMQYQPHISVNDQLLKTYSPLQTLVLLNLNQNGSQHERTQVDVSLNKLQSGLQQKLEAVQQLQRLRDHRRRFENRE